MSLARLVLLKNLFTEQKALRRFKCQRKLKKSVEVLDRVCDEEFFSLIFLNSLLKLLQM